jgi:DNA-binding transcriptional MerR regulator
MELLTIGELAQASGLSAATIRRYGAAGILVPERVDDATGYRWYSREQVKTAVLARTLRAVSVPLEDVRLILEEPDAASRLARLDRHWAGLQREVAEGRRERDHLARLFSGFQELIDGFEVEVGVVPELPVLLRRRVVRLRDVEDLADESERLLRERAEREGRDVLGPPLLRYGWPPDRAEDDDDPETPREVEVCLPVTGDPDAMLHGGPYAFTEVRGELTHFPQLLAAYGAVSQWARAAGRTMLGQAREERRGAADIVVGWVLAPEEPAPEAP